MKRDYPRLLIIANQCLSRQTSNGRTLRNFLVGWPQNAIAQFCTQLIEPDNGVCNNYYCVTDKQVLNKFLKRKESSKYFVSGNRTELQTKSTNLRRNSLTMLVRDFVWNNAKWKSNGFDEWVDAFAPQVVLLQAGDNRFMFRIARLIATKYNIPLVIYNSEGYYFKKFDYFRSKGISHFLYPLFHFLFCREFEKTLKIAKKTIYICDTLKKDYDKKFHLPSETIYTATDIHFCERKKTSNSFVVSYLGNLGVGRHESLLDIADALQKISPNLFLNIYGKIPNDKVKKAFASSSGIVYKGFVSYDKVVEVMQNSDLLVHCESFDPFFRKDSKYAFSTKIADSLACGTPFLLYAPEEFAVTKYLRENNVAFVASSKDVLQDTLENIYKNVLERLKFTSSAYTLVSKNHNIQSNVAAFQNVILDVCSR